MYWEWFCSPLVSQTRLAFQEGKGYRGKHLKNKCHKPLPVNEGWIKRENAQPAEMETEKEVKFSFHHPVLSSVRERISVSADRILGLLSHLDLPFIMQIIFFRLKQ